jgi:hypothetical protein
MEVKGAAQTMIGAGNTTSQDTYNFNYQGNATPQQVFQSYEMARAMG